MPCIDGIDPADFESGILDPGDIISPVGSELSIVEGDSFFEVGYITFEVNVSPINYLAAVSFDFSTSNGTATAGTHYTARTGVHVALATGVGLYVGQINVLKSPNFHGDKTLTVTISGAVNATIAVAAVVLTIPYDPKHKPTDPAKLKHHQIWGEKVTVYDQSNPCTDRNECTGYAVAAAVSAQQYLDTGKKQRYNAHEIFDGSGGPVCSNCPSCTAGWDINETLAYAKATGAKEIDSTDRRKIRDWGEIDGSDKADLIKRIKRNLYNHGPVVIAMIWYPEWNSADSAGWSNGVMPDPGAAKSSVGHSVIIVGWNNDINKPGQGAFLIQSSFGLRWNHDGRAWLPYSYINTRRVKNGTPSDPWFRFYWTEIKRGG
jgi:hypothetical protein